MCWLPKLRDLVCLDLGDPSMQDLTDVALMKVATECSQLLFLDMDLFGGEFLDDLLTLDGISDARKVCENRWARKEPRATRPPIAWSVSLI